MPNMRSMANTTLVLPGGLVNVPVKMYAAVSEHETRFNMFHVHDSDGSAARVSMPCVCQGCDQTVPRGELVRGTERNGEAILVTDEELEDLQTDAGRSFDVLRFVGLDEIDSLLFEKAYFLEPDVGQQRNGPARNPRAAETYITFMTALENKKRAAVVKYTMRQTTHLATVRVATVNGSKVLAVQNLSWPDELRTPDFATLRTDVTISTRSLELMDMLIDQETEPFDAEEYIDTYAEAVKELIDCKEAGVPMTRTAAEPTSDVTDLMAALEMSIAAKARSKSAHPAGKRAPAKKTAPATAKKVAPARRTRKTA